MATTDVPREIDEDELDLKEIFGTLKRYKFSILIVLLLFSIGAFVYAYMAPDVYRAKAYIEVQEDQSPNAIKDFLAMAESGVGANINNVIDTFKMPHIGLKALENLNIDVRYFAVEHFKKSELYRNSPFVVVPSMSTPNALESTFKIVPLNRESFRLTVEPSLTRRLYEKLRSFVAPLPPDQQAFSYDAVHRYGEQIDTRWFSLKVEKVYEPSPGSEYLFNIMTNDSMLEYIQKNLSVAPLSKEGSIVEISFLDQVPQRAKEIVDALIDAYMGESLEIASESAQKRLKFLDEQLEAINKALQGSAEKLQEFKSSHIITEIGQKATITTEKLSELQTQLYEIDMRLSVLRNLLTYIRRHRNIKGINVESMSANNQTITALIMKIQELYAQRDTLLASVTESHPDVIKVTKELESLRHSLIESIKSSIRSLQNRKQSLLSIIKENEKKLQELPEEEQKLAQLHRNFMVNEKIYSYLLEKRAETAIVAASAVPKVRVSENAFVGKKPVQPKRALIVMLGIVLGLIVGVAFAFLRNFIDDTVKTTEDLERLTKLPLYGVVPHFSQKNLSTLQEALRVIRTNLEFLQSSTDTKIITMTSTVPKEGKSTTISELGKILAKSGKRVILLDLDMRRPRVHAIFKLSNEAGISTLLVGKSTLKESIKATHEKNFHLITAGPTPPNPSELLLSKNFKNLIMALQTEYDYILLDSPPIGIVSDAMAPMKLSDLTLFMLRANYSKKTFLKNINWLVTEYNLHSGIILNDVRVSSKKGAFGFAFGA
ncbi:GumC family protein, partial [Hydrogenimonas sp.]